MSLRPPMPLARAGRPSLLALSRMMRRDVLSALPERLYRARLAEFRTPLGRSFLTGDPDLADQVLKGPEGQFPKSRLLRARLAPLFGRSVFLAEGPAWHRQRAQVAPAFCRGAPEAALPAIGGAAQAMMTRLDTEEGAALAFDRAASHVTADVICRILFSRPIDGPVAADLFERFRAFQDAQPVVSLAGLLPLWLRRHGRAHRHARAIHAPLRAMIRDRRAAIRDGTAPDDPATAILRATGDDSAALEQIAVLFLAGHETSAASLSWAAYLLAVAPDWQARIAEEASPDRDPRHLPVARAVLLETLRLYPPVPFLLREAAHPASMRGKQIPRGAQIAVSPWHMHRNDRYWPDPHRFHPARWLDGAGTRPSGAFLPFSAGLRACPGAALAMTEGTLLLSMLAGRYRIAPVAGRTPVPVAQLTLRARDGIWLRLSRRTASA